MTAGLRILMVIPQLGFGGAEGAFLRLAAHLGAQAGVTIAVMGAAEVPDARSASGRWTELPLVVLGEGGAAAASPIGKLRRWWRMGRRLRVLKRDHDVTISFLSGANLLNALTGPRSRVIVSERGSKRNDIGMTPRQRALWTRVLDPLIYWRAGRVVAASDGLAHEIVSANPWVAGRLLAIEGTVSAGALVDAADMAVEAEFLPLAEYETVVVFGRLHVQKGYDVLLAAFARVRAERPRARLLLIGDGPEAAALRAIAARLGLTVAASGAEADVILPGARPDPLRYLRLGRVFALPSRLEGLPNALIEALATGVPVLASDCPWGPRSILSGGALSYGGAAPALPLVLAHGVLMPLPDAPGAVAVWAEALARAVQVPREAVPRAARLAVVERYDIARTGPVWRKLAETMAQKAGRR